jgi:ketosteroid isomerase-like protein
MADSNLKRVKHMHKVWNSSKGRDLQPLLDIIDDDFRIANVKPDTTGLTFMVTRSGKQEAIDFFQSIFEEWTMVYYRPEHYVAEGDNVAMFGMCKYIHNGTKNAAECRIANLWRFQNGKAIELIEVFDSAAAVLAATPKAASV